MRYLHDIYSYDLKKIAIVDDNKLVSYEDLIKQSDEVAQNIINQNKILKSDNKCIAIESKRNWEAVVLMLGILKAGYYFVFIDHNTAMERKKTLRDIASALLTLKKLNEFEVNSKYLQTNHEHKNLCYGFFTSGTTGIPKCALFDHQKSMSFIAWAKNIFKISESDIIASIASFSFDISIFDIFVTLHSGATLLIVSDKEKLFAKDLYTKLDKFKVSVIQSLPSLWLPLSSFSFPNLKKLIFTGEAPNNHLLSNLKNKKECHYPNTEFYNLYGQTEANSYLYYNFTDDFSYPVPISITPLPNYIQIIDKQLCTNGPTLMLGYKNENNIQSYNTNDLVYIKDNKCFLNGRSDLQFKYQGIRSHPEEIEKVLNLIVQNSCVIFHTKIYAFIEATDISLIDKELLKNDLINHCKKHLPNQIVPFKFYFLDKIPANSNGKTDRTYLKNLILNEETK